VEIDRVVPASGNLGVCGQQFWLGTGQAGRLVTLWIDTSTVHLALDGIHPPTPPPACSASVVEASGVSTSCSTGDSA
jgi:hypothetical protein